MSINAVDARVKTATLTGIVSQGTAVPPDNEFGVYFSDDSASNPKLSMTISGGLGTVTFHRDAATQNPLFGDIEARKQPGSWEGNFTNGDTVLFSRGAGGANPGDDDYMEFIFSVVQQGVGFQVARNSVGSNWHAVAKFYDASDVLLLTVTRSDGVACFSDADPVTCPYNSAVFMGAAYDADDAANIKKVRINVFNDVGPNEETFGINFMTFGPFDPLSILLGGALPPSSAPPIADGLIESLAVIPRVR